MRILVDQDGPIADFETGWLNTWRTKYPDRIWIPLEHRTTHLLRDQYPARYRRDILNIYCHEGFYLDLAPIPGAIQALHQMIELGHDVRICTRPEPRNPWCESEKRAWVRTWLGPEFEKRVIFSSDKTHVYGHILIEDCPNPRGSRKPTWQHVIFDRPYNRSVRSLPRIVNWENWEEILEQFA